jgi:hypothetical protein
VLARGFIPARTPRNAATAARVTRRAIAAPDGERAVMNNGASIQSPLRGLYQAQWICSEGALCASAGIYPRADAAPLGAVWAGLRIVELFLKNMDIYFG